MGTLSDLAHQCAKETERFFHGQKYDPQHCFELFRHAILNRDPSAWEAVYEQYQPMVGRWVMQHQRFDASGEEVEYFINRAFEKLWVALTPAKFKDFTELGALLRYLKMCVHSVITDYSRSRVLADLVSLAEESVFDRPEPGPSLEEMALNRTYRQSVWDSLLKRLHDEKERRVMYGSFILALKPRELYDQSRSVFASVEEVYLIKQNVLSRLRRDEEFHQLFEIRD
jgi:RNA polymerase sigma factor (sigma-70 family)